MSATKDNCKDNKPCGCEDDALTTGTPCDQNTPECPDPDPCPETFAVQCNVWTGNDLRCGTTVVATAGDRLDLILQRMVALFCNTSGGNPPQSGISVTSPNVDETLIGTDDLVINIDRNNCFEDAVFTLGAGAPAGILFTWVDGGPQSGTTMTRSGSESSYIFNFNISGVTDPPGVYNFNVIVTACGVSSTAAMQVTIA